MGAFGFCIPKDVKESDIVQTAVPSLLSPHQEEGAECGKKIFKDLYEKDGQLTYFRAEEILRCKNNLICSEWQRCVECTFDKHCTDGKVCWNSKCMVQPEPDCSPPCKENETCQLMESRNGMGPTMRGWYCSRNAPSTRETTTPPPPPPTTTEERPEMAEMREEVTE